jgi:hypothetical protein
MNTRTYFQIAALAAIAAAGLVATQTAGAQPIMPARTGIDPNTFIVGHPASPQWRVNRIGGEHPAVQQLRAGPVGIDANTFTVQPPASVNWLAQGETPSPVLVVAVPAAMGLRR